MARKQEPAREKKKKKKKKKIDQNSNKGADLNADGITEENQILHIAIRLTKKGLFICAGGRKGGRKDPGLSFREHRCRRLRIF